jgi:hypothetical protein
MSSSFQPKEAPYGHGEFLAMFGYYVFHSWVLLKMIDDQPRFQRYFTRYMIAGGVVGLCLRMIRLTQRHSSLKSAFAPQTW